jgi:hypothetical protein
MRSLKPIYNLFGWDDLLDRMYSHIPYATYEFWKEASEWNT